MQAEALSVVEKEERSGLAGTDGRTIRQVNTLGLKWSKLA
jgi:hypothetical protein